MKSHNGMRPQDIVVLLKILSLDQARWRYRDLALSLFLSISEVSEALTRSHIAGLIDESRRKVFRKSLMEFIEYGLHYVFPQQPGTLIIGIPTAHSHPAFKAHFTTETDYVWPDDNGSMRGLSITPLYKGASKAALQDSTLHLMLAAIDIIRVGQTRELKFALNTLYNTIL
ncbi:hypothetical protein [Niabella sp.]|uniref:hypothetical protein n=1 Tax=Niabella sp. TaxID=1962976 RepID=UPI00262B60F5|nr:hypothetical protein [Niabella sp.]